MAGDWIKMRGNLWDDPRVAALVDATDTSEAAVIGGLYWLWATADQHTEDGVMPGLTLRQIDRKTGVAGLGAALCAIGWLEDGPDGVRVVNFTEHNGASAKRRATDAQRKATGRSLSAADADISRNRQGQATEDVRGISELEKEKRREEIQEDPTGSLSTSQPTSGQPLLDGLPDDERQVPARPAVPPCPYDALLALYHELCPTMPGVRADLFKTGKRAEALLARWKWVLTAKAVVGERVGQRMATDREEGIAWFRKFFLYASKSPFLRGEKSGRDGRRWVADLGWMMKLENFEKVLEGKYHGDVVELEAEHA